MEDEYSRRGVWAEMFAYEAERNRRGIKPTLKENIQLILAGFRAHGSADRQKELLEQLTGTNWGQLMAMTPADLGLLVIFEVVGGWASLDLPVKEAAELRKRGWLVAVTAPSAYALADQGRYAAMVYGGTLVRWLLGYIGSEDDSLRDQTNDWVLAMVRRSRLQS